jgi:hypothetical protein
MGPSFTAGIVSSLGVSPTAALVAQMEAPLTGSLVQHFGPGACGCVGLVGARFAGASWHARACQVACWGHPARLATARRSW